MKAQIFIFIILSLASNANAQVDQGGNGGKTNESNFFSYVRKIERFLAETKSGRKYFPEVSSIEYSKKVSCLHVSMLKEKPLDKFDVPRDAVNYLSNCSISVYEDAWEKLAGHPSQKFSFVFHEMLGLLEIEVLKHKEDAVDYHVSSKIERFVDKNSKSEDLIDLPDFELGQVETFEVKCQVDRASFASGSYSDSRKSDPTAEFTLQFSRPEDFGSSTDIRFSASGDDVAPQSYWYSTRFTKSYESQWSEWNKNALTLNVKRKNGGILSVNFEPNRNGNALSKWVDENRKVRNIVSWSGSLHQVQLVYSDSKFVRWLDRNVWRQD